MAPETPALALTELEALADQPTLELADQGKVAPHVVGNGSVPVLLSRADDLDAVAFKHALNHDKRRLVTGEPV
jgi:hypothetical protein